jgi:hypothetical protein
MMTRAQCSSCGNRMAGIVARESYIYCDYCVMKALRWLHDRELADRNPFAVYLGLHASRKATNHSRVCWHMFLPGNFLNPPENIGVQWPTHGDYSYESIADQPSVESNSFPEEALDIL